MKAERGHQMFVYPRTQSRLGDSTQYTNYPPWFCSATLFMVVAGAAFGVHRVSLG